MSTLVRMLAMLSVLGLAACSDDTRTLTVTATAYTSSPGETDARPDETLRIVKPLASGTWDIGRAFGMGSDGVKS